MSNDTFIFEDELEKVKSKRTQEYLNEVLSTYHNREYRSCIVILYAITFTDFLEKIKLLDELYQDIDARTFLQDFEKQKNSKVKYSELERIIKDYVIKRKMINDVEVKQWEHLKDYRDYCAHPVVGEHYELISPRKEQVRAHIRNMFEAIFLKDAILNNKIFDEFLLSIESYYDRNKTDRFNEYLKSRYLVRLDIKAKQQFVKNLWKMCFYIDNEECKKYREIVFITLEHIINSDTKELLLYINQENSFFNGHLQFENINIEKKCKDINFIEYHSTSFLYFLFLFPDVKKHLTKSNIQELELLAHKNINYLLLAFFLYPNSNTHISDVKEELKTISTPCINNVVINYVYKIAIEKYDTSYNDLIIYYFFNRQNSGSFSPDYDYINSTYYEMLKDFIPKFTLEQTQTFLSNITHSHTSAHCFKDLVSQIKQLIEENNYSIDFSIYHIDILKY